MPPPAPPVEVEVGLGGLIDWWLHRLLTIHSRAKIDLSIGGSIDRLGFQFSPLHVAALACSSRAVPPEVELTPNGPTKRCDQGVTEAIFQLTDSLCFIARRIGQSKNCFGHALIAPIRGSLMDLEIHGSIGW